MENILDPNGRFLELFHPYIVNEWRHHYFAYDKMKRKYSELKEHPNGAAMFEGCFYEEIEKVDEFTAYLLFQVEQDLKDVEHYAHRSDLAEEDKMALERILQDNFAMLKEIQHYHKLNIFVICKTAKKFAKLQEQKAGKDFEFWRSYPSFTMFNQRFCLRKSRIKLFKDQIIDAYGALFRRTYKVLTIGELKYVKDRSHGMQRSHRWLGVKLGIIVTVIVWLLYTAFTWRGGNDFFQNPALYVYTAIGNILLFRLFWGINVFLWTKYGVNYISLLNLNVFKPNINQLAEQTTTHFLMFMINLLVFTLASQEESSVNVRWLQILCPLALIGAMFLLVLFEILHRRKLSQSNGNLYNLSVFYRMFTAPFQTVRFRDVYTADILTSFTRIISDGVYATCWILSGAVMRTDQTNLAFGSPEMQCRGGDVRIIAAVAVMIPLWIRLMQCTRVFYETRLVFPHAYKMLKYSSSIAVVIYSTVQGVDNYFYYLFLLPSALFKSWWDAVMDWGLFERTCRPSLREVLTWLRGDESIGAALIRFKHWAFGRPRRSSIVNKFDPMQPPGTVPLTPKEADPEPIEKRSFIITMTSTIANFFNSNNQEAIDHQLTKNWYLRETLMYPQKGIYYISILLDIILRFIWVSSLIVTVRGDSSASLLNSQQMKFFFGSLEIFRRFMWSHFRLEHEHIKFVHKKALGFSQQRGREYYQAMVDLGYLHQGRTSDDAESFPWEDNCDLLTMEGIAGDRNKSRFGDNVNRVPSSPKAPGVVKNRSVPGEVVSQDRAVVIPSLSLDQALAGHRQEQSLSQHSPKLSLRSLDSGPRDSIRNIGNDSSRSLEPFLPPHPRGITLTSLSPAPDNVLSERNGAAVRRSPRGQQDRNFSGRFNDVDQSVNDSSVGVIREADGEEMLSQQLLRVGNNAYNASNIEDDAVINLSLSARSTLSERSNVRRRRQQNHSEDSDSEYNKGERSQEVAAEGDTLDSARPEPSALLPEFPL